MPEPNYLINAVGQWFLSRPLVIVLVVVVFMALMVGGIDSCRSRKYDKQRADFEAQSKAWATERAVLLNNAEAKEKRIAELEPKAIAFDALADQNKRIDAGLAQQIEEVSKNAANEEARANEPTNCFDRIARVCERLRANNIRADCERIKQESCPARQ